MKTVLAVLRYIIGALFIFSGYVKLIDPVGTQIKMEEYFEVFAESFHPMFHTFIPYSLSIAVAMCVIEVVLGFALLLAYQPGISIGLLLLMVVYFSFLTFYSAYYNKVTDCGCFGDFMKLKPWHSFTKDMVLLFPILFLFIKRRQINSPFKSGFSMAMMILITAGSFFQAYWSINHLPPIDFRAYKVGANIPELMKPSAPLIYEYIMEKGGKQETFKDYPTDTTYKFVSMEMVNPEAMPKIKDFSVWNDSGDFTQEMFKGVKLAFLVLNAEKARRMDFTQIVKLSETSQRISSVKIEPLVLTSSDAKSYQTLASHINLKVPYYYADAVVMKTIMRSNPGIWLLKDGVVKGKWHFNDTPSIEEVLEALKK